MNDYQIFKQIIRECNYDNTYKMAWAKALVEISCEVNLDKEIIKINFQDIAKKYIKYYWNQTIFFNLIQGSNPYKPPKILTYVKELINEYKKVSGSNLPELYEKIEIRFDSYDLKDIYNKILRLVKDTLKIDVSWRFLNLGNDKYEIYTYNKGDDYLLIKRELLEKFRDNDQDLYDLINYKWGLILETFNNSPKIN